MLGSTRTLTTKWQGRWAIQCSPISAALSYSNRHADLLFELISRRYQNKSTVVTTNKSFGQWHEVFPNASCVVSLIDRLVHRCEVVAIEGESYRLKEAKERTAQKAAARASAGAKAKKK